MGLAKTARTYLRRLDVDLVRYSSHRDLYDEVCRLRRLAALLKVLPDEALRPAIEVLDDARSQLGQDIFALSVNRFKPNGFFVEFGATNGKTLSNTWLLEKRFGWTGILAEPARTWHAALAANREVIVEHDCVWSRSGEVLKFSEVPNEAELSTISDLSGDDRHAASRRGAKEYEVTTIAFTELLSKHSAPPLVDFLSIDTEGSELEILSSLDWDRWKFRAIACEHNFTPNREKIANLLAGLGYQRVYTEVSDFDDWFVLKG